MLTDTNIGSYGKDSGSSLGLLLQKLGALNRLKRIRLGSIEPSQIDSRILDKDKIYSSSSFFNANRAKLTGLKS